MRGGGECGFYISGTTHYCTVEFILLTILHKCLACLSLSSFFYHCFIVSVSLSHVLCSPLASAPRPSSVQTKTVDLGYLESVCKLCRVAGVDHFSLVSSQGASTQSPLLYSKTKGKGEKVTVVVVSTGASSTLRS